MKHIISKKCCFSIIFITNTSIVNITTFSIIKIFNNIICSFEKGRMIVKPLAHVI